MLSLLGKEPSEATFTGNEFLTYDLVQLGGEAILSNQDEVSLHFRTNRDDGLLFYTGTILTKGLGKNGGFEKLTRLALFKGFDVLSFHHIPTINIPA